MLRCLDGIERILIAEDVKSTGEDKTASGQVVYYCVGYAGTPLQNMWSQEQFGSGISKEHVYSLHTKVMEFVRSK